MEVETAVVVLTAILVDLLVLAYAGKWLIAKWKENEGRRQNHR